MNSGPLEFDPQDPAEALSLDEGAVAAGERRPAGGGGQPASRSVAALDVESERHDLGLIAAMSDAEAASAGCSTGRAYERCRKPGAARRS